VVGEARSVGDRCRRNEAFGSRIPPCLSESELRGPLRTRRCGHIAATGRAGEVLREAAPVKQRVWGKSYYLPGRSLNGMRGVSGTSSWGASERRRWKLDTT